MISDWRGDRRLGSAPLSERAGAPVGLALTILASLAGVSVFVVFVKTLGQPLNWFTNLRFWALIFGIQVAFLAVGALFGPRKGTAIIIGLLGGAIALLVWFMALPILTAFGVVMIVPIR